MVDFKRMLDPEWQAQYRARKEAEEKAEAEKRAKFFQPGKSVIHHYGGGYTRKVKLVEQNGDMWAIQYYSNYAEYTIWVPSWELDYLPTQEKTF